MLYTVVSLISSSDFGAYNIFSAYDFFPCKDKMGAYFPLFFCSMLSIISTYVI